jgi:predicted TPR repeat methyltransferase
MTKNQWDKYAKIFDEGIGDGEEALHRDFIDPMIFNFLGSHELNTVVDAGCGNGYLCSKLAKVASKVVGLDFSEELLKAAGKRNLLNKNVTLLKADLSTALPLKDQEADVLVANMVLQYVPSLDTFSMEAGRILTDQGLLVIIVDHPGHYLFARAQELVGKKDKHFIDSGSYFAEGMRRKNSLWNKAILEYYHRPISGYIKPFTSQFRLVDIAENSQNGETPRLLGLKFIKSS